MMKTIVDLAWAWFRSNINLPFNQDVLKEQAFDVAYNQGLPALVTSLEQMVPGEYKNNLDHGMWQALKQAAQSDDPTLFVQQATTALKNSGQAEEILKHVKK